MHIKSFSLFYLTSIHLLLFEVECLLQNKVTERCVHVEYNRSDSFNGVFAKECSWSDAKRNRVGNKDQWLELHPVTPDQRKLVRIRKVDSDFLVCISANGNRLTTGDCDSTSSVFLINKVQNFDRAEIITLEHPEGTCVSIHPGFNLLTLEKCTENDAFQQWTVCRHINKCDVEALWSPRAIVFRSNAIIENPLKTSEKNLLSSKPNEKNSTGKIFINEILYYLQNKLTSDENEEQEGLITQLSSFYKEVEIDEAIHILTPICNRTKDDIFPQDHGATTVNKINSENKEQLRFKVVLLLKLYKNLSSKNKLSNYTFVSKNMARVPENISIGSLLLFEKLMTTNIGNAINSLETVKNNLKLLLKDKSPYPLKFHAKDQIIVTESNDDSLQFPFEYSSGKYSNSNLYQQSVTNGAVSDNSNVTVLEIDVRIENSK